MPAAVTALLAYEIAGTAISVWIGKIALSMVVSAEGHKKPKGRR